MNPEQPPTKEQVKAKLRQGLTHLLGQETQPVNLITVQVPDVVSNAMSASGVQNVRKVASFFPNADATARGVLDMIGGAEDIMVVPNGINMQGENKAITMKAADQVELYRGFVETAALKDPGVDAVAVKNRVVENMILVKEKLTSGDGTEMKGTIWHEHGHVLYDATESGKVFAHELEMLHKHLPSEVLGWIHNTRTLAYFARYVADPGLQDLQNMLQQILPDKDFQKYLQLRYNVEHNIPVEKKDAVVAKPVVDVGNPIEGTIDEIKETLGLDANVVIQLVKGAQVTLANCVWQVEQHFQEVKGQPEFDIYKLRRVA